MIERTWPQGPGPAEMAADENAADEIRIERLEEARAQLQEVINLLRDVGHPVTPLLTFGDGLDAECGNIEREIARRNREAAQLDPVGWLREHGDREEAE